MTKTKKILLIVGLLFLAFIFKATTVNAAEYIWPIVGENATETYIDYEFYGNRNTQPIKDGKSGREYIVDNEKWPNELKYYARCESHYGMDITGIYGHSYTVASVVDGKVLATSANRAVNPSINYVDRNCRRTTAGLRDGGGYGNYVIIQETLTGRCFLYAHLKAGSISVKKGDVVTAGQTIATMGSSGDSGHTHLHFEIRKSKAVTLVENRYGSHYLYATSSSTNLDPKDYIGSSPKNEHTVSDGKLVRFENDEDLEKYIKYLYRLGYGENVDNETLQSMADIYKETNSVYEITKQILLGKYASLDNEEFVKATYEIILCRGKNYTIQEMQGHIDRLNTGKWTREDYVAMLCNCIEFKDYKVKKILSYESIYEKIPDLAMPGKTTSLGDLNGDGIIDSSDASIVLKLSVCGISNESYIFEYADINLDGKVDASDASEILYYSAVSGCDGNNIKDLKSFIQNRNN